MTDNEIIKALECCRDINCSDCPLREDKDCLSNLRLALLDLINRQQAEIERLKDHNKQLRYDRKQITSEAIKEFAERLKEKSIPCVVFGRLYGEVSTVTIDNLVEEMVGDE